MERVLYKKKGMGRVGIRKEMASKQQYHFVLIHGGSHGAWCWYKLMDLLRQAGHKVSALDMAASGNHPADALQISSFLEYTQPLTTFFEQSLLTSEKVVLVGHSLGGLNLMHASQFFPQKIAVAVYIAAVILPIPLSDYKELLNLANSSAYLSSMEIEVYGKGPNNTPTSIMLDTKYAKDMYYNMSPTQDVVLASISSRPAPVGALNLNFNTTKDGYGSVPIVFIKTENDKAFLPAFQDNLINLANVGQVLSLASDHSPFFSLPQKLQEMLINIANQHP